jgi:hypothetical protein
MTGPVPTKANDWNAADAERGLPRGGLLARIRLPSAKGAGRRALKDAGARRLRDDEHPRFRNIGEGVADRLGVGVVDLWVMDEGGPNALCCKLEHPTIAARRSLLESYARTELEAVVAHCLVRYRDAGQRGALVGYADDVRAAALTRYPPALAAAIEKAEPYVGRFASFYLVADGPSHRPTEERVSALRDL